VPIVVPGCIDEGEATAIYRLRPTDRPIRAGTRLGEPVFFYVGRSWEETAGDAAKERKPICSTSDAKSASDERIGKL
jgi:hypothetical protein